MRLISGRVVDGKVQVPDGVLAEGEPVAVLALDDTEPIVLSEEDQREMTDRIKAIARGEFVDGDEFLRQLKGRHTA